MTIYTVFQWCDNSNYGRLMRLIGVFSDKVKAEKCKKMAEEQIKKDCSEQVFNDVGLGDSPYFITIESKTINRFMFAHETESEQVFDLNDVGMLRNCDAIFLNNFDEK